MRRYILELGFKQERYMLPCDNQNAIYLGKNLTFHPRSKYIDMKYRKICGV